MLWQIRHLTRFQYSNPVRDSLNEVRLQPLSNEHQTVEAFALEVQPHSSMRVYRDFYSNTVHHLEVAEPHPELAISSRLRVRTHPRPGLGFDARPAGLDRIGEASQAPFYYDFIQASRFVDTDPETWRLALDAVPGETDSWQCALRLMGFVHGHLKYQSNSTRVHTHMKEVLAQRAGVCQDFAHVMLGLCRTLRIPAMYVSGYLASEAASATHAWTEVFIPGAGWQALDPTHNRAADETYIKIGVGRDYSDVAPIKGHYRGTTQRTMNIEVQIERQG